MVGNSLVELDRLHLIHPVASWRGHEAAGVRNGLVIRAFANGVLGYAPPLCCTEAEIDAIVERTRVTLDQTQDDPDVRAAMA